MYFVSLSASVVGGCSNPSTNKCDILYACRLCWQHANFHLHFAFAFVKLHKKHRQLFAQNSSAKRTACLIVIQVVSRLKQTTRTRTTASTRINYPRKLLANNAQRNGTAHGNAGADRTGPGSGYREYRAPGSELRYRFRFAFVLGRSLSALCGLCVLAMSSSLPAEVRVCVHDVAMSEWCSSWPGLVAAEQWNCDRNVSLSAVVSVPLFLPPSLSVSVWVCLHVCVLVTCKWMQRKWNEFVRGRKKRSVKRAALNELRTLQTVCN